MTSPAATVVVVPRDRWGHAPATLSRLLEATPPEVPVVYVDGGSPRRMAAALERAAATGRIQVVRRPYLLAGNEARNLGAALAHTPYIAFLDNDTLVSPGWLPALVRCADETSAPAVLPVYLIGDERARVIHGTGVDTLVEGVDGRRRFHEAHHHLDRMLDEARPHLSRTTRDQAEWHCLLVRTSVLERVGGLDESLLSWFDHIDFGLTLKAGGEKFVFEPDAVVTYLLPSRLSLGDLGPFLVRWSSRWYRASLDHLCRKWGLDRDDPWWDTHWRYRGTIRDRVPTPSVRVNAAILNVLERFAILGAQARRRSYLA